jgi:hypothetical protein
MSSRRWSILFIDIFFKEFLKIRKKKINKEIGKKIGRICFVYLFGFKIISWQRNFSGQIFSCLKWKNKLR